MTGCVQVTTTLPHRAAADRMAARAVAERVAACAQVVGPVASTYRWEGRVEAAAEWYCHLKTTAARLPALVECLGRLHPYDVPEIIALPSVGGDPSYLAWIEEAVALSASHPPPLGGTP